MTDEPKPERWQRIKQLFQAASLKDAAEQLGFLQDASKGDQDLLHEVLQLLHSEQDNNESLEAIVAKAALDFRSNDLISQTIGPYQIQRLLGEGGMGQVFLAKRIDQHYEKQVAIKVLAVRRPSSELIERFRSERQILATLQHPNIAQLFDGGETDDGLPYLVMEYVAGLAIDDYCDVNTLSTRERLKLFTKVCSAVEHAHANKIIHRDIKPNNILISELAEPKLLDFGIAKFLQDDTAQHTQVGERVLSPLHASPEQVRGETITRATDIYSLGVLLYEILCGTHPYQTENSSVSDIEKAICETDPIKPSRRITKLKQTHEHEIESIAQARGVDSEELSRMIGGDLDNIVLMALNKEPERRYSSIAEFREDIQRFLEHRPILAKQASVWYRFQKFIRRNQLASVVALSSMVLLSLIAIFSSSRIGFQQEQIVGFENDLKSLNEQVQEVESVNVQLATPVFKPPEVVSSSNDLDISGLYKFVGYEQINEFRMLNDYTLQVKNTVQTTTGPQNPSRRWFVYIRVAPNKFQAKTSIATYTVLDNGHLLWESDRRNIELVPVLP